MTSSPPTRPDRVPAPDVLPIFVAALHPRVVPAGWPLLRLGFRPFYLGAALFASVAVPWWVMIHLGLVRSGPSMAPLLLPLYWHAHDMLFGFAVAVIVGFLFTAGKAWTGQPTPRGAPLAALALLWLAARVAAVTAPYAVFAVLDVLLLPIVALLLLRLLLRAGNRRNLPLVGLLGLLALANAGFHLAVLGALAIAPMRFLHAGLALIVMVECVMAARVVPAFTMAATPGLKIVSRPRLDAAALAATALALALWVLAPPGATGVVMAAVAALLLGVRQWGWQPWVTRRRPILWILHAACAWLPIGLALIAAAQACWAPASAGVHALAVGATGGLIIGMVTRTARGHTGRPLKASGAETAAYLLVMAAALVRVLLPLALPAFTAGALVVAATAWALAFGLYAAVFAPWLLQARLDGSDG